MPLSDHEKRLLDEIEQTLLIDDPTLASSLRSARPLPRARTLFASSIALLASGATLLITGLLLHGVAVTVLGVASFVLIVAGTDVGLRTATRIRADRRAPGAGRNGPLRSPRRRR